MAKRNNSQSYASYNPLLQRYLRQVEQIPLVEKSQERELERKAKKGDLEALTKIFRLNIGIFIKLAKEYESSRVEVIDLIQEGQIGLMKALERHDPDNGSKLITYAFNDIAGEMKRYLTTNKYPVARPVNKAKVVLEFTYLDEPREYKNGEGREAHEETPSDEPTPSEKAERESQKQAIRKSLNILSKTQRKIIELRFGLKDGRERTQKEVAKIRGTSKNNVSLLEIRSLEKLRDYIERHPELYLEL